LARTFFKKNRQHFFDADFLHYLKKNGSSLFNLAAAGINFSQDVPGKEQTLTDFR